MSRRPPFVYMFVLFLSWMVRVKSDTECPVAVVPPGDRRENKNRLRLMQYNVEWLFVDYCSSANCPGNGCTWHTEADAATHMDYVANVVYTLNPDILNLCEVEGCDELSMLSEKVGTKEYNMYLKRGTDTATGQNVGLLAKIDPVVDLYRSEEKVEYPIAGSTCGYVGAPATTSLSKHYITEYGILGMKVALIGVHLIAIPTDVKRCSQREAQAQIIQNVVYDYIRRGYEVIVMGDMNDYDGDILDMNSDIPLSSALSIIKGARGQHSGAYNLTNVAYRIEQAERYSDWYDSDNNCDTSSARDYSMIDHILVTPAVDKKIADAYIFHGYKEYCGKWNSDHYPVVIDFMV